MYSTTRPSDFDGWRKSSHSGKEECVEVKALEGGVGVRDSKNPDGGVLRFSREAWGVFLTRIKAGEL